MTYTSAKLNLIIVNDFLQRSECDRQSEACPCTQSNRLWVQCGEEPALRNSVMHVASMVVVESLVKLIISMLK